MTSEKHSEYDYLYKILIVGNSGVGKSSILLRFTENIFSYSFLSTIGVDFKVKTISLDNDVIKLQIWDTAGQERFKTITSSYYRGGNGAILVFDVSMSDSFENIKNWLKEIDTNNPDNIPKILVGNKIDLNTERVISSTQAKNFADSNNLIYIETSSKDDVGVYTIFETLSKEIKINKKVEKNIFKTDLKDIKSEKTGKNIRNKQDSCCT
jgi:Ras-related protein Rab-1A